MKPTSNNCETDELGLFLGEIDALANGGDKGKLGLSDQSFRTPIIFSWPNKMAEGISGEELVYSADIPATILDCLSIPIPADWFGRSMRSIIEQ